LESSHPRQNLLASLWAVGHARRRRRFAKPASAQDNQGWGRPRRARPSRWHRLCVLWAVPPPARGGRRVERTSNMITPRRGARQLPGSWRLWAGSR